MPCPLSRTLFSWSERLPFSASALTNKRLVGVRLLGGWADSPGRAGDKTGAGRVGLLGRLPVAVVPPCCSDSSASLADCSSYIDDRLD